MIQDQVDAQLAVDIRQVSSELELNPSYLSREFSKYFDDLNFGDYVRKRRIEKAIELMSKPEYSLTAIAYLTGFSDQSHFTRTFKNIPAKALLNSKKSEKSKSCSKR
ncbi:helix-turn-helix transcriptional regulator [Niabella defluvii]|nr:helix-turn-helix transcriptional regulator [Niabella sp. I65]